MTAGLAMLFIEAPAEAQQTITVPQYMKDQCASLDISATGNAAGKMSATDLSGAPHGPYPQKDGFTGRGIGAMIGTILAAILGESNLGDASKWNRRASPAFGRLKSSKEPN